MAWTAYAEQTRKHLLEDVIYHGWPGAWRNSPPKFEEIGTIETGEGYLLQKPVMYTDAPDIFCLDLYEDFDIDRLIAIAGSTKVLQDGMALNP